MTDAQESMPPPSPPAGWYAEPGTGHRRYWSGSSWGQYAPPEVPVDPNEGRTVMIVGYSMAGASLILPILGLAGLILGIITATKPGRGGHGAAIICLSIILAVASWIFWLSVFLQTS